MSEKINSALDKGAPMKTFKIKPKYIHGLSQEAKELMRNSSRDSARLWNRAPIGIKNALTLS